MSKKILCFLAVAKNHFIRLAIKCFYWKTHEHSALCLPENEGLKNWRKQTLLQLSVGKIARSYLQLQNWRPHSESWAIRQSRCFHLYPTGGDSSAAKIHRGNPSRKIVTNFSPWKKKSCLIESEHFLEVSQLQKYFHKEDL